MLSIEVFGDPAPQGSKRVFNGRVVEAAGNRLKLWRKQIATACLEARKDFPEFFTGAVEVRVTFYLPRPKTISVSKRALPIVPPDVDKLARALLDGIGQSEVIWGDDSQVCSLTAIKVYADNRAPGAEILINRL